MEKKKTVLPVCNDCGRPLFGRKKAEDRCLCETVGNWRHKEMEVEEEKIEWEGLEEAMVERAKEFFCSEEWVKKSVETYILAINCAFSFLKEVKREDLRKEVYDYLKNQLENYRPGGKLGGQDEQANS